MRSFSCIVRDHPDQTLTFTVERAGETLDLPVTPRLTEIEDRFGQVHRIGLIGVSRSGVEFKRSNPVFAVVEGFSETFRLIGGTLYALGEMIVGSRTTEELGGPLRIAQMSGEIAKDGVVPMIWFTAVLSINLGLINLFPIPMLDGGHLVMYGIEAAAGPAADGAQPGDGFSLRPRPGNHAHDGRDLERSGSTQRHRVLQRPGVLNRGRSAEPLMGGSMTPRLAAWAVMIGLLLGAADAWTVEGRAQEVGAPAGEVIRRIEIEGNQRIEAATIRSYLAVGIGDAFDPITHRSFAQEPVRDRAIR